MSTQTDPPPEEDTEPPKPSPYTGPCLETLSLPPVTTSIQRIVLYETKTRFYVVGSTQDDVKFRVMKIDRTAPTELIISDDKIEYSKSEVQDLLATIHEGNKANGGLQLTQRAWGILGFIRFLEGYYIILITKRSRKAVIGGHYLYEIQDTKMVPIQAQSARGDKQPSEQRYMRIFSGVDLNCNFYFSYTYDLTNTLQYNMSVYTKAQADLSERMAAARRGEEEENLKQKARFLQFSLEQQLKERDLYRQPDEIPVSSEKLDATINNATTMPEKSEKSGGVLPNTPSNLTNVSIQVEKDDGSSVVTGESSDRGGFEEGGSDVDRGSELDLGLHSEEPSSLYTCARLHLRTSVDTFNVAEFRIEFACVLQVNTSDITILSVTDSVVVHADLSTAAVEALQRLDKDKLESLHIVNVELGEYAQSAQDDLPQHTPPPHNSMFAWNSYLLSEMMTQCHRDWVLPVIHGFVAQNNIDVFGRPIYLTLIARRSRHFAGARFLKRGANERGHVANHVETEQIVHDATSMRHDSGRYTSYVQMRGSIPLFWSQDNSNMAPKPAISLDRVDPFYMAAALHFDSLFRRFGAPVIVFNLVKQKEKKPREQLLYHEFNEVIDYLNQFLPDDLKIVYEPFDMARSAKSKNENVIDVLEGIVEKCLRLTGIFHSGPYTPSTSLRGGVLRVNCIDCLDRTNAAELLMGKCAFAHQLHALGLLDRPQLPFFCDAVRALEEMYESHGDTIALQYGGSQLVNTMETYRKRSQWSSHSRDLMNAIHRYYSNAFVDADKQGAINLFLGVFVPYKHKVDQWELPSDYYLHYSDPSRTWRFPYRSYTRWWSDLWQTGHKIIYKDIKEPDNYVRDQTDSDRELKGARQLKMAMRLAARQTNSVYYMAKTLTHFHDHFPHTMNTTVRFHRRVSLHELSPFKSRAAGMRVPKISVTKPRNTGSSLTVRDQPSSELEDADSRSVHSGISDLYPLSEYNSSGNTAGFLGKPGPGSRDDDPSPITKRILMLQIMHAKSKEEQVNDWIASAGGLAIPASVPEQGVGVGGDDPYGMLPLRGPAVDDVHLFERYVDSGTFVSQDSSPEEDSLLDGSPAEVGSGDLLDYLLGSPASQRQPPRTFSPIAVGQDPKSPARSHFRSTLNLERDSSRHTTPSVPPASTDQHSDSESSNDSDWAKSYVATNGLSEIEDHDYDLYRDYALVCDGDVTLIYSGEVEAWDQYAEYVAGQA